MSERIGFINLHIHQVPRLRTCGDVPRLPRHYHIASLYYRKSTLNSAWNERDKVSKNPKKKGKLKMIRLPALSSTLVTKRTIYFDMQNRITFPKNCKGDFRINFWTDSNYSLKQNWRIDNLMGVQCVFCDVQTKGRYCFWDPQVSVVKTVAPSDRSGRWIRVWRWKTVKQPPEIECGLS